MPNTSEAQSVFDADYINATEIAERVGVSRVAVLFARRRNVLPGGIQVGDARIYIWKRVDIEPYIKAWELDLAASRFAAGSPA